ncbi:Kazal-type serine protease inhibitor domain-containing protein [Sinorhizobium sp. 7-81]|nr:Kazal-type serine protease inhibitor domain-containing protein [Sinorhizobium sp. 8-89]MDK1489630.1 Kazal-type serine protease inhibitor domain-containing protein [Sinorhizobium sp. 8-89]
MSLLKLFIPRSCSVILMGIGFLSACTVVVDEPRPGPRPIRPGPICTMEFDPVCGERGNRLRTFPNACQARADGFRVIHRGQCRPASRPPVQQACTREFAPVCGQRGPRRQTFPNACTARAEGFRIIASGECRGGGLATAPQACTMEFAPVCGVRGGRMRTFPNACEAGVGGFSIIHRGECR